MRYLVVFTLFMVLGANATAEPIEYSLPDLDGNTHSLADYRGKWLVVNYWATWCPPCQEELPDLVSFYERHKDDGVMVIGINFEDIGREQLRTFVDSFLISYPIWRSEPLPETPLGPIPGLPTTYIVDPKGQTVARQVGPITAKQLEDYINKKKQLSGAAAGGD